MQNLSKELTVFLITCGENPNYNDCLSALKNQSIEFNLEIIKNHAPMSKAFQEMLNSGNCTTPYFIQCDDDMILYSDTIEKMYNQMINKDVVMLCYELKDIHLDTKIFGIKIYKYDVFKNYPYNLEGISTEMDQLKRVEQDGHKWEFVYEVMGSHSPLWSEELIFERYYDLMQKYKKYNYKWMEFVPKELINKIKKEQSSINLFAFLGAISGLITPDRNREKDYTKINEHFLNLKKFFK